MKEKDAKSLEAVTHTHTLCLLKGNKFSELYSSGLLLFIYVEKIYLKYKNFKDRLCLKIACPFCVLKEVIDTT